ncbi:MAG: hypothetical protein SVY53_10920 [Chloroflexota bacterium]|nr:hypothetical protein [Chloroflexota bacterium]
MAIDRLEEEVQTDVDALTKFGTIGGFDMQVGWGAFDRATLDATGLSSGWRLAANIHTLSAIQRPGRSIVDRGEFDFYDTREGIEGSDRS